MFITLEVAQTPTTLLGGSAGEAGVVEVLDGASVGGGVAIEVVSLPVAVVEVGVLVITAQ